jgi:outer membrane protein OmpA-like peptidoglycan-associated protein
MKQALSLIILLNIFAFSSAQQILLFDDFLSNVNEWKLEDNDDVKTTISNGFYLISRKKETGGNYFKQTVKLDPQHDYSIETVMKQTDGTDNHGYGLVFGLKDNKNFVSFIVSSNGNFRISEYINGEYKDIVKWTKSPSIKPMNSPNFLIIKRTNGQLQFFINDELIDTRQAKHYYGNNVGFYINNRMSVEADYIKITGTEPVMKIIENAERGYQMVNLGANINSEYTELSPAISPDGNTLFYIRGGHPENIHIDKQDIWISERDENGKWKNSIHAPRPLNNEGNNSVISVTPDGNTLLLSNTYKEDGSRGGSGVSISYRTSNGWSIPQKVIIKNYYNHNPYVGYNLSADRKVLLMSIERDDSYGEKDLYVSFFQEDGSFSEPVSLGLVVNTNLDEMNPFLAADNRTLYFASYGHPGYGSADLFVTRRLDETWTNWSVPENLGPEINSAKWDSELQLPASGEYAYLVSSNNSLGKSDLFEIKLHESARPTPVVLIQGKVLNKKTKEPIEAEISYYDLTDNKEVGIARSNPNDGSYKIVLPSGKVYSFLAKKESYYSVAENIDMMKVSKYIELERDLLLAPLIVGETIRLNNLFFDINKATLKEVSFAELNRLVKMLNDNPTMKIEIEGHTDSQGADLYNVNLSNDRVKSVVAFITTSGINADRLKGVGYGKAKPVATNDTEEGRALNRRVEFRIIEN